MKNLKIKKVDDKPMVIHTKVDTKLHVYQKKGVPLKGQNVLSVNRSSKIKGSQIAKYYEKIPGKISYRKYIINQNKRKYLDGVNAYHRNKNESKKSINVKNSSFNNL